MPPWQHQEEGRGRRKAEKDKRGRRAGGGDGGLRRGAARHGLRSEGERRQAPVGGNAAAQAQFAAQRGMRRLRQLYKVAGGMAGSGLLQSVRIPVVNRRHAMGCTQTSCPPKAWENAVG